MPCAILGVSPSKLARLTIRCQKGIPCKSPSPVLVAARRFGSTRSSPAAAENVQTPTVRMFMSSQPKRKLLNPRPRLFQFVVESAEKVYLGDAGLVKHPPAVLRGGRDWIARRC